MYVSFIKSFTSAGFVAEMQSAVANTQNAEDVSLRYSLSVETVEPGTQPGVASNGFAALSQSISMSMSQDTKPAMGTLKPADSKLLASNSSAVFVTVHFLAVTVVAPAPERTLAFLAEKNVGILHPAF